MMSRHLVKILFATSSLCFGIFGVTAACNISPSAGWEYNFADKNCNVPSAITIIKQEIDSRDHFQAFTKERDEHINFLGIPTNTQKAEYEKLFTGLVYTLWVEQERSSTSKLRSTLKSLLPDMRAKYKDELLTFDERTKFAYLYFLNFAVTNALEGQGDDALYSGPYVPKVATTGSADGLTFIQSYATINGKIYGLWHSDIYYMFSRGSSEEVNLSRRTRSLDDLINYLEHQNRLVMQAPNGRKYAIRKYGVFYKINRDNGTILSNNFSSSTEAQNFINTCAVNTVVPAQYHMMCGFNNYGR